MPEEDLVDIKFRLYDGSDIGPFRYSSAATVDMLKQRIVSDWPRGKNQCPRLATTRKVEARKSELVSCEYGWDALSSSKTVVPKSANEVKLINSGKILENNKTVGQCKVPFGEIAGSVIIMHVVVQPSLAKTKAGSFSVDGEGRVVGFDFGTKIVNSRLGRTRALNEFPYLANCPRDKVV
ncbi:hypothetical protein V8G54_004115 [Vigna mungo]|uniref:UBL3-like ubiquitin domain-containing protein n=1 Tax=Vigna mungo TaxID=3915 RepID=A0AAQ3PB86_VIGMU